MQKYTFQCEFLRSEFSSRLRLVWQWLTEWPPALTWTVAPFALVPASKARRTAVASLLCSGVLLLGMVLLSADISAAPVCAPASHHAPSPSLVTLSQNAGQKSAWPQLRSYAQSTADHEQKGLAWFALASREYDAGAYAGAAADFARAAEIHFAFEDLAAYYEAASAQAVGNQAQIVQALTGFTSRYPESLFHHRALVLLGGALLQTKQPQEAIRVLTADPKSWDHADVVLLLARAYWQAQRLPEATREFQQIYYGFPNSSEADVAGPALEQLAGQMGSAYPAVPDASKTQRLESLDRASRYTKAVKEYQDLLRTQSGSSEADHWRVGLGESLERLKRAQDALSVLTSFSPADADLNARRLAALVSAEARLDNKDPMLAALNQLQNQYPHSQSYASALDRVGDYFVHDGDWSTSVEYYQPLAANFPDTPLGMEAGWRVAWSYYLARDHEKAWTAFSEHVIKYPESPHASAAIYWLGRIAEARGSYPDARAIYAAVEKSFPHGYYRMEAGRRLRLLDAAASHPAVIPAADTKAGAGTPEFLALVAQNLGTRKPRPQHVCKLLDDSPERRLKPFELLRSLGLESTAGQYLNALIAAHPGDQELILARGQMARDQVKYSQALWDAKRIVPNSAAYPFTELPSELWRLLYPQAFWDVVRAQAARNGLDPYLVMGLIRQESGFDPRATSRANARGLMQILPDSAPKRVVYRGKGRKRRRVVIQANLYDPEYNVQVACRFLHGVIAQYNGNLEQALAAYNAGDGRVRNWLRQRVYADPSEFMESIPFDETRGYVQAVLRDREMYRQMLTGAARYGSCGTG
jgi:soluble lytic murein transglycosylase